MLTAGIILLDVNQVEGWLVKGYQPTITAKSVQQAQKRSGDFTYRDTASNSLSGIINARRHAKDIAVIGAVAIPQDNVYLPIGKGVSKTVLALAAGTMKVNQTMGQGSYALAGHNMDDSKTLFSPIYAKAKPGQKVYISDFSQVYVYQITDRQEIPATDLSILNDTSSPTITLITCNWTGSKRIAVKGKLVKTYEYKAAPQKVRNLFAHQYNQE